MKESSQKNTQAKKTRLAKAIYRVGNVTVAIVVLALIVTLYMFYSRGFEAEAIGETTTNATTNFSIAANSGVQFNPLFVLPPDMLIDPPDATATASTTPTIELLIKPTLPATPTAQKPAVKVPPRPAITPVIFRRTLSVGSRGDDVLYLQRKLTVLGYLPGSITGRFTSHTRHAVIAFQKVNGLKRDGVAGKNTYDLLSNPKMAAPRYPSGDHVEINKKLQVLLIVKNGKVKYIASTSTGGRGHTTPSVSSAVDWKSGPRYVSKKYGGIMVWPSFFYGGVAVHGYSSVPAYPASHGCARVPIADAKLIYNNMPKKSMVYVY